ncbi:MAG: YbaB/EbfC family nucleoid-associated protein [Epsilonproteobacteria bacterium]|nr:nucleoid-associated protein, YbaB/EbfC family [Campylobacterota bacterium]NPA57526.1 YbaB/EbfC family nucleoid-associated protein [Campylobacterota bacterium]
MFDKIDMQEIGKVFQEIQEKAKQIEEESEKRIFSAKSGGGMVEVSANGKGEIVDVKIDDSLLEDREALEILLISAINDVLKMVEENRKSMAMNMMSGNLFGQR